MKAAIEEARKGFNHNHGVITSYSIHYTKLYENAYGTEFRTPDGKPYNPDFVLMAQSFGVKAAQVTQPGDLAQALADAFAADEPYLLDVHTRGDVPMPRTGYWDIADFLAHGND